MDEPLITPDKLRDLAAKNPCVDSRCADDFWDLQKMKAGLDRAAAEIDRLQSALDAAPVREERAGACFCEPASLRLKWFQHGRSFVCLKPCWINQDTDEVYFPGNSCPVCCAELGDGVARRWKERE